MSLQVLTGLARTCLSATLALLIATPASAQPSVVRHLHAQPAAETTFVNIVPASDGATLFVEAGAGQELQNDTLYTNIRIGPGGNKRSYTMSFSETNRLYYATVVGLSPRLDEEGSVEITSTLGLNSGLLNYKRVFVPQNSVVTARTDDSRFELRVVDEQALPSDTYLAITPSAAPPGPPPPGHRILGSVYSARAPEPQIPVAAPFFIVNMNYNGLDLGGADLRSLGVFAWDASGRSWEALESVLLPSLGYVSAADQRFTTFSLMVRPAWLDEFDDGDGLAAASLTNISVTNGALSRADSQLAASARTLPVALPPGAARWGSLTYAAAGEVAVDVLAGDGTVLVADAPSGVSLTAIDPSQYPTLTLRASFPAGPAAASLERWQLGWQMTVGLTISQLTQKADGTPRPVIVTTDPPGLPARVTYEGVEGTAYGPTAQAPTAPGRYRVEASVDEPGAVGKASATLTIEQQGEVVPPKVIVHLPLVQR